MYIIIIGAGGLGFYLAQLLLEEEHDAIVVDKDPARCETISRKLPLSWC